MLSALTVVALQINPNCQFRRYTGSSQIQKRNGPVVEIYISEDKELSHTLLDKKDAIEADASLTFDWRELPKRKASRIVIEKDVTFYDKNQLNAQFEWIIDVMLKMKKAFKNYF